MSTELKSDVASLSEKQDLEGQVPSDRGFTLSHSTNGCVMPTQLFCDLLDALESVKNAHLADPNLDNANLGDLEDD